MLNDLYHWWSTDLSSSNTGDLQSVTGTVLGQQRIVRRLLTCPGDLEGVPADYLAHPDYGAGLPRYIGQPIDPAKIVAVIRAQLALESVVAQSPQPQITIKQLAADPTGFNVTIAYNDATTRTSVVLSFDVSQ